MPSRDDKLETSNRGKRPQRTGRCREEKRKAALAENRKRWQTAKNLLRHLFPTYWQAVHDCLAQWLSAWCGCGCACNSATATAPHVALLLQSNCDNNEKHHQMNVYRVEPHSGQRPFIPGGSQQTLLGGFLSTYKSHTHIHTPHMHTYTHTHQTHTYTPHTNTHHIHTQTHIAFLSLCLLRDIPASKGYKLSNIALFSLAFYACPMLNAYHIPYKTEHVKTK